jgi:hypothetical protein
MSHLAAAACPISVLICALYRLHSWCNWSCLLLLLRPWPENSRALVSTVKAWFVEGHTRSLLSWEVPTRHECFPLETQFHFWPGSWPVLRPRLLLLTHEDSVHVQDYWEAPYVLATHTVCS